VPVTPPPCAQLNSRWSDDFPAEASAAGLAASHPLPPGVAREPAARLERVHPPPQPAWRPALPVSEKRIDRRKRAASAPVGNCVFQMSALLRRSLWRNSLPVANQATGAGKRAHSLQAGPKGLSSWRVASLPAFGRLTPDPQREAGNTGFSDILGSSSRSASVRPAMIILRE
jgi:hypothetical protein